MQHRAVLTGGACTGKTTLLHALIMQGFLGIPEIPTIVFTEERAKGTITRGDSPDFQKMLLERQLHYERNCRERGIVFLDRSCIDMIAYCRFFGIQTPPELTAAAWNNRYDSVFILDFPVPFEQLSNTIRWGTVEDAKVTHKLINDVYCEFGYRPIAVPKSSINERVSFTLRALMDSLPVHASSGVQPLGPGHSMRQEKVFRVSGRSERHNP